MDVELRFHIESYAEDLVRAGVPRAEAMRRARLEFGGIEQTKEKCREVRSANRFESFLRDLRYALRTLRKSPSFTAVCVLTLALGIGANTAIFSVIEAVLLSPLPYQNPARLVLLTDSQDPQSGAFLLNDIEAFKSRSRSFQDVAAYYRDSGFSKVTLTIAGETESAQGAFVSANFFLLLGVPPALGRVFTPQDEIQRARVVVLSHGLWRRRFGGSQNAIGKVIPIDGVDSQIIGVMPAIFQFPARDQQFWAPLTTNRYWDDPVLTTGIDSSHTRYFFERWQAIGRLSSDVTMAQAQAEVNTVFRRSEPAFESNGTPGITLAPLRVTLTGNTRLALMVLFCAVSFVLAISCANVANLMLARGATREREMAVRTVLGAGRGRLLRQVLTESAVLGVFAGGIGLLLASIGMRLLIALAPADIPRLEQARLDRGALAFTLAISLLAAGIFGFLPAWKVSRSDPGDALRRKVRSGGLSLTRTRSVLVIAEIALAFVLLAGAGLLVRSFLAVESVDPGFDPGRILTMNIALPAGSPESRNALYDSVLERVRTIPGVQATGEVDTLFELGGVGNLSLRAIDGRNPEPKNRWTPLSWASIRGDYFQAMGTPLLRGRYFTREDGPNSLLVAIIDESMARRYWPAQDPIGKRFKGQDPRGRNDEWLTVVGVVGDMRRSGLEKNPTPHVYEPYGQAIDGGRTADLVVRITGDPRAAATAVRQTARELSSTAILSNVSSMEQQLAVQLSPRRFQTSVLSLFSGIAMVLAAVGIFGVMHYSVAQRTHEIGIRAALGARPRDALRLVLGQAAKLAFWGIALGISVALAVTRFMGSLLFGIGPADPITFIAVPLLLTVVDLLASCVPAWRATRVDPMVVLRYE
jgi:predicted permease